MKTINDIINEGNKEINNVCICNSGAAYKNTQFQKTIEDFIEALPGEVDLFYFNTSTKGNLTSANSLDDVWDNAQGGRPDPSMMKWMGSFRDGAHTFIIYV